MTASRFVAGRGVKGERRPELIAGLALISVPMLLFLVLNIGAIFYAAYISLWRWGLRGPRALLGTSNYEAAAIDGAGAWQAFRSITFPLLRPAHFFVATLLFIGGFQLFDQALIAGGKGGEPNNALTTIVLFIYRSAISDSEFGFAAAVGMILLVLIFTVTLIQRRVFGDAPSW